MTANQTIDGAPRGLLEAFAAYVADSPNAIMRARAKELRALLDAPCPPAKCRCAPLCYLSDNSCPVNGKPAAQPHGEPVAWQYRVSAGPQTGWSLWHDGKGEEFKQSYQVETRPLYASPPAPVSVVMPERPYASEEDQQSMTEYEIGLGHGACEMWDKIKTLNSTRPAHANPPPGTEPSGTHHDNDGLDEMRKPK